MSVAPESFALDLAAPGEVVAALEKALGDDLISVVLFGSRARDEADEASDWDVLIIARNLPERVLERYRLLKRMLPPAWRGKTSILAKTPAEFEATLSPLYLDIALDGRVLYDPQGYMQTRLQAVQRLIQRKGLRRERRGRDLVWQWERLPGLHWLLGWEETS